MCWLPGDLHHGVHVVRLAEAVLAQDQEELEKDPAAVLEEVLHPDPVGVEVRPQECKVATFKIHLHFVIQMCAKLEEPWSSG